MRTLHGLEQSPWTEKARWALDHHEIAYRYAEHLPVLGEIGLRLKAGKSKVSVPLLVDEAATVMGSLEIARHADANGSGAKLFPEGNDEIGAWVELSDRIIGVGRAKVFEGLRTNRAAQREALPPFIPSALRGLFTPMTVSAAWFLAAKYRVARDVDAQVAADLRPALEKVRSALADRKYLAGGAFSFADVAIGASLHALRPHARSRIGPATRHVWTQEALASEYEDLLDWRDALYEKHRR
ncbi:MAG: glutathione S-transferase [Labilithrix sp.]|nr:glutathione S-transferase [Labilithrix sp.]